MEDCIFCKIVAGQIPSKKVFEDDSVMAFYDVDAKAPIHVLVIPKKHIQSILQLTCEDDTLVAHIIEVARNIATELGVSESGFRLVANTGADGGQSVNHLHFHLLGGRNLSWPPG